MKKIAIILIGIIYISSIAIISIFGVKSVIYDEKIPVTSIVCTNVTDNYTTVVENSHGEKVIKTPFTQAAKDENDTSGTKIQLTWKVLPDNASNKNVKFIYPESTSYTFVKNIHGDEVGLITFYNAALFNVTIQSTDGTKISTVAIIWAMPSEQ